MLGRQVGTKNPGGVQRMGEKGKGRYLHDGESMQRLWDEIGERTGTRWKVKAELSHGVDVLEGGEEVERSMIRYVVKKLWGGQGVEHST